MTTAFKRYGDDSAFTQLMQTGLGDVRVIIVGISALLLGILLILEGRFKVISRGIKVCKSKFMSFMAVLLVASMLSGMLGGVSASAAGKANSVTVKSGGSMPGTSSTGIYVSKFTYGVRMYLVPAPEQKNATEPIVRLIKTKEINDTKLYAKGAEGRKNLRYAVNKLSDSNYKAYRKYSKNAFYTSELLDYIPSSYKKLFSIYSRVNE